MTICLLQKSRLLPDMEAEMLSQLRCSRKDKKIKVLDKALCTDWHGSVNMISTQMLR